MKAARIAAAAAAVAITLAAAATTMVLTAGTHSATAQTTHAPARPATLHTTQPQPAKPHHAAPTDHALAWLESPGGQAQVTLNNDIDTLAADLQTESHAPTVANHLAFEADARTVRAQAEKILRTPALLPHHNRAAYQRMLRDFITVANLLQPGPGYGTTSQDYTAWYTALKASNITVW